MQLCKRIDCHPESKPGEAGGTWNSRVPAPHKSRNLPGADHSSAHPTASAHHYNACSPRPSLPALVFGVRRGGCDPRRALRPRHPAAITAHCAALDQLPPRAAAPLAPLPAPPDRPSRRRCPRAGVQDEVLCCYVCCLGRLPAGERSGRDRGWVRAACRARRAAPAPGGRGRGSSRASAAPDAAQG